MKFDMDDLKFQRVGFDQIRVALKDPAKRAKYSPQELDGFKRMAGQYLAVYQGELSAMEKAAILGAAGSILPWLIGVLTWLYGQPWYVQLALAVFGLVILGIVIYYVYMSKDRWAALRELIAMCIEIIKLIQELQNNKPVADFTVSPMSGRAPLMVQFVDTSAGSPTSWQWNFGDGASSAAQNPSHTFQQAGTYTVGLVVSNASGMDTKTVPGMITVTKDPQPSQVPPGVEFTMIGSVELAKIGGEHQVDMPVWLQGGQGWPAGTVRVMDSSDPDFDVLPNDIWAYWYDGGLAPKGWMISQQGYYYYEDNPVEPVKNVIHSMVDRPWVQPGKPVGIPLSEVMKIERENDKYVLTVLHDGVVQRIVWGKRE